MLQHPKLCDTDEDLIKQDEAFKSKSASGQIYPSAKVVQIGKRKTEDRTNDITQADQDSILKSTRDADKPKSKFAEVYLKKKREGIVDNTILNEAASRKEEKCAVISPIVERNVPSLSPLMKQWNPLPCLGGFPQVPRLNLSLSQEEQPSGSPQDSLGSFKKKSIYMRQMEKEKRMTRASEMEAKSSSPSLCDEKLIALGNASYILDGKSGLGQVEEAERIHVQNISRLSEMSHDERLKERNELMSKLTPEQVTFIQSLRLKKDLKQRAESKSEKMETHSESVCATEEGKGDLINHEGVDQETGAPKSSTRQMSFEAPSHVEESPNSKIDVKLPIDPEEAKKWVHMDKVELEKLKWMTKIPQPKPLKRQGGFIARFSFQGDLLPYDSDISWREGLHHHGDEPGRAGYTLDELFVFVRSQVVQQRHLGLKTLANILRNAGEGLYDTCFDIPVIQLMIDAGLVLLLRFSIDETTALVYQEALRALYFLVSSEADERCLFIAEPWVPLGIQPGISSLTNSREKDRQELDAEEKELKDVEVIKLDATRALLRMDVHLRLRYLLESVTLSPPDVIHIFGILKRIARHSLTSSWTLVNTPRLLSTIVNTFLPHNTTFLLHGNNVEHLTTVYGIPLSHALSFMKVLASRGRQIAATLIEKHDLVSRIMAYISLEPTEIQMPLAEILYLSQEAYFLWSIFLSYGLTKSQQGFSTFYPLFVKQLIFYRDKVDLNSNIESNQFNYEIGAHLGNVLRKGLCVAATKSLLTSRMKNNEPTVNATDRELILPPPTLDWEEFREIVPLVEICLSKWANQMANCVEVSFSGFKLVGSFCNFLNAYLEKWRDQISFEGVAFVHKVEFILSKILSPLLKGDFSQSLVTRMRNYSALYSSLKPGKSRDPDNLGSLWCVCEEGKVIPILRKSSPFPFLLPVTNLLKTMYTLHPVLDAEPILAVLNSEQMKIYLSDICSSRHSLSSQWFSRIEIYCITNILQLASLKGCEYSILYHRTALTILPLVHKGDDHIVKSLISDVICSVNFAKDLAELETQIDTLSVKEYNPLKSPAASLPFISHTELTRNLFQCLPSVGQNLIRNVLHSTRLQESLIKNGCIPFLVNELTLERQEEVALLDPYWCLTPLKLLLQLSDAKGENVTPQSSQETISSVVKWLQMTYFLLKYRKSVALSHATVTGWFRHLSNVYLASNDLFLDVNVNSYNQACLIAILEDNGYKELNCLQTFPGLPPTYDWYKRMIDHFAGVSYGDSSFALFIIIPLMRKWPSSFRLLLFGEHDNALPFIRLSTEDVSQFIPMEQFLFPAEEDADVLLKYRVALAQQMISERRTPFLYHFATHHIRQSKMEQN